MSETGPRLDVARVLRSVAVFSTAGLVLVVLGLASVAVVAEFYATWTWYFRMEQAMSVAAPATLFLLVLAGLGYLGTVAVADRD